jgi:hypothetical protein
MWRIGKKTKRRDLFITRNIFIPNFPILDNL